MNICFNVFNVYKRVDISYWLWVMIAKLKNMIQEDKS